jgi:hypothetical protein
MVYIVQGQEDTTKLRYKVQLQKTAQYLSIALLLFTAAAAALLLPLLGPLLLHGLQCLLSETDRKTMI